MVLGQVWGSGASELTYSLNGESSSHSIQQEVKLAPKVVWK